MTGILAFVCSLQSRCTWPAAADVLLSLAKHGRTGIWAIYLWEERDGEVLDEVKGMLQQLWGVQ